MRWISILYFFEWFALALVILLILLILLLMLPVNVEINNSDGEFKVKIRLWFLDFEHLKNILPKRTQKNDKPSKATKDRGKYKGMIKYFRRLIVNTNKIVRLAIKNIKFKKLNLKILVGSADAAKTAIEYGEICSVFYPAAATLIEINEPKNYNLTVTPDFAGESIKADVDINLKVRLFNFLIVLINIFKIIRSN